MNTETETVYERAVRYRKEGLGIVPIISKEKKAKFSGWTDPNFHLTEKDLEIFKEPGISIGVLTGLRYNRFVIDLDNQEAEIYLLNLAGTLGPLPPTLEIKTGKGRHLVFRIYEEINRTIGFGVRGFDILGENSYTCAEGTVHENGNIYTSNQQPIADLPKNYVSFFKTKTPKTKDKTTKEDFVVTKIPDGERNLVLYKEISAKVKRGHTLKECLYYAKVLNEEDFEEQLDYQDIHDKVTRAFYEITKDKDNMSDGFLEIEELRNLKSEPLIDGLLETKTVNMIYGPSSVGKSFFTIDLALRVANNLDWFGHKTKHVPVLYIVSEGIGGMYKRIKAWEKHHNIKTDSNFKLFNKPIDISSYSVISSLCNAINQLEEKPQLIVFDIITKCYNNMDENSADDMKKLMIHLDEVVRETDATVLFVHHSAKNDQKVERGSTAIKAALNTSINLAKESAHSFSMTVDKQRDAEAELKYYFSRQDVTLPEIEKSKDNALFDSVTKSAIIVLESNEVVKQTKRAEKINAVDPVLEAIRKNPGLRATELVTITGKSKSNISKKLKDLFLLGLIEKKPNKTFWEIKNEVASEAQ